MGAPRAGGADLVAGYIALWRPSSVSPEAAAFARDVIGQVAPEGRERAKNLLRAAGKLADYAVPLGLEPVPGVLLHPPAAERFTRCAPGLSGAARRTLRTNLRFIGRRVVPHLYPADAPLPRDRARQPYPAAEVAGFLALAAAQPTAERRARAAGLACLSAGAGLIRGGLRSTRGSDVAQRSGGVVVAVRGARARAVPVLARYHGPLLAAARFAGDGADLRRDRSGPPEPHHAWSPRWMAGAGCRGRALPGCGRPGWLAAANCSGRRRSCTRPGSAALSGSATWSPPGARRGNRGGPAAGGRRAMTPLARFEEIIDDSGVAPLVEAVLPAGVRARQLAVRTLLPGMMLALADGRPAHLTRVHQALAGLPKASSGGSASWRTGRAARTC